MTSKNIYLQLQIADILRKHTQEMPITITEIYERMCSLHDFKGTRKTIDRNLLGMSNEYKVLSSGERPAKYWIDSTYEPEFNISLNPTQIQLITYALRNLKESSTKPLQELLHATESAFYTHLPHSIVNDLKYALKSYKTLQKRPPAKNYSKNNITEIFYAIRKKYWITARIKEDTDDFKKRHTDRKLAIINIWFENGIPYLYIYDSYDQLYKIISATQLNGIKVKNEIVSRTILKESRITLK